MFGHVFDIRERTDRQTCRQTRHADTVIAVLCTLNGGKVKIHFLVFQEKNTPNISRAHLVKWAWMTMTK